MISSRVKPPARRRILREIRMFGGGAFDAPIPILNLQFIFISQSVAVNRDETTEPSGAKWVYRSTRRKWKNRPKTIRSSPQNWFPKSNDIRDTGPDRKS